MNTHQNSYALAICRALAKVANPLSAEQVVIMSWLESRETMGLRGYEQEYPDARKTQNTIYGKYGLQARGYVALVDGGYVLTEAGRKVATDGWPKPMSRASLVLENALKCRAMRLYREGRMIGISLADAREFWGLRSAVLFVRAVKKCVSRDSEAVREVLALHLALVSKFGKQTTRRIA